MWTVLSFEQCDPWAYCYYNELFSKNIKTTKTVILRNNSLRVSTPKYMGNYFLVALEWRMHGFLRGKDYYVRKFNIFYLILATNQYDEANG